MTDSQLASFISTRLAPHLNRETLLPQARDYPLAVMFADISGFTPLAEHLAGHGASGAEELTALLNSYFGRLVDLIDDWGGEVFTFAGDALMAFWLPQEDGQPAALRAAACGLDIQQRLNHYPVGEGLFLSLHLGIAAGPIHEILVGGVGGCLELLITGPPLEQMAQSEHLSSPGTVVLSPTALAEAGARLVSEPLEAGYCRAVCTDVEKPATSPSSAPAPTVEAMHPCVPRAVAERLLAGQSDWLAEIRRVTVLFFHLQMTDHVAQLTTLHETVQEIQRVLDRLEVSVDQWLVDDKGTVLIAAAGLPPWTHEDDAERGVRAGVEMRHAAHHHGLLASVGITTGRVFCGPVGNATRRRYTIIGDVVNLSARLMQNAKGGILCDTATSQAVSPGRFTFETLPAIQVKGKAQPVTIFRPQQWGGVQAAETRSRSLVGRQAEVQLWQEACDRVSAGVGATWLLTGEPGMGKTRFLQAARAMAQESGMRTLVGEARSLERTTAWHAWCDVFAALYPSEATRLRDMEEAVPDLRSSVPVMQSILPLQAPELPLSGRMRAETVSRVATALLHRASQEGPLVILLEGAQFFDSASWELAQEISEQVPRLLLVLSLRPLEAPLPQPLERLQKTALTVRLEAPGQDELAHIAALRLGATALSPAVAAFVVDRAAGNPLFAQEMVAALNDDDLLVHRGARLDWKAQVPHNTRFPDTMQGLVLSRIDRLHAPVQLTLKTASVIGLNFDTPLLRQIHPLEDDRTRLPAHLAELMEHNLVALSSPARYVFSHNLNWEAAYNLLLVSQRRALHQAVAAWMEEGAGAESPSGCAALARHWSQTSTPERALPYCIRAGEMALQVGAYEEAVHFLELAAALDPPPGDAPLATRLPYARRERGLGQALHGLDRMGDSRDHLERALQLLDHPLPSAGRAVLGSLEEAAIQLEHRLLRRSPALSPEQSAVALESARVYELLLDIFFLSNDTALSVYGMVRTLNLAEAIEPSPELARAYAGISALMGLMRLPKPSRYYSQRALEVARQVGDRAAEAFALYFAGYTLVCGGDLDAAAAASAEAAVLALDAADRGSWQKAVLVQGLVAWHKGDLDGTLRHYQDVLEYVERKMRSEHRAWSLIGIAQVALRRGEMEQAVDFMQEARRLVGGAHDRRTGIPTGGILAMALERLGRRDEAVSHADDTMRQIAAIPVGDLGALPGYVGALETYLQLWQQEGSAWERPARAAAASLRRYAGVISLSSPYALVTQARVDALRGRTVSAVRQARAAWEAARRRGMPWEEALAAGLLASSGAP